LNSLYHDFDAMYYNDQDQMGFEWINCDDPQSSIISFIRRGSTAKDQLLFVCNFTPMDRDGFIVGVPCPGKYTEILNSDDEEFGGLNRVNANPIEASPEPWDGRKQSITMHLPPLSVVVFKYDYKDPNEKESAPKANEKKPAAKSTATKKPAAKGKTAKKSATKSTTAKKQARKPADSK
ncbi:MAG: alpha amylase C-terminal domain-containing protein, partial [Lachnospiraceae bacterium]|nr:alpha amylase C-terminal domain-containing protein [Lachnospiraceae bacterium]